MDEKMILPNPIVNRYDVIMPQSQTKNWAYDHLGIGEFHVQGVKGKGSKVVIIDTGADCTHSDLLQNCIKTHNVSGEKWGVSHGHGTAVAGIIGAADNSTGIIGVAPEAELHAIKAMKEHGGASYGSIVDALVLAKELKPDVVNMSLGGPHHNPALENAVIDLVDAGVIVVCAAGNAGRDDSVMYPGAYEATICVGASNKRNEVSSTSSRGWAVDVCAPGERLLTTHTNNGYSVMTGTSFASPIVSGVAALLTSAGIKLTHALLKTTSMDIEEEGLDVKSGNGLINPAAMVNMIKNLSDNNSIVMAYQYLHQYLSERNLI